WAKWSYLPRKNEMQRGHNPNWLLRWPPLLCALLHQQFVGENAQAIDCSCLDPQNDRTERDRPAPAAACERQLRRREIAFRTNQHQDAGRKMAMFARIVGQDFL